jgi:hypothetical protein
VSKKIATLEIEKWSIFIWSLIQIFVTNPRDLQARTCYYYLLYPAAAAAAALLVGL